MDIIFKGGNISIKNKLITAVKIKDDSQKASTYIITKNNGLYVVNEILRDYVPQSAKEKIYANYTKND